MIISSVEEDGDSLKKLSIENNKLINDSTFNEILEYSDELNDTDVSNIITNKEADYYNEIEFNNLFSKPEMNDFVENSIKTIEKKENDKKKINKKIVPKKFKKDSD